MQMHLFKTREPGETSTPSDLWGALPAQKRVDALQRLALLIQRAVRAPGAREPESSGGRSGGHD